MYVFNLVSSAGKAYKIMLPDPHPRQKSAYVFAFHKSGSTLIHDMLRTYCKGIGVPTFSLFDSAFQQGVSTEQIQLDAAECFKTTGYVYTGFRHFPYFDIDLRGVPTILLARDPRDMLVSLYYSIRNSHVIPKADDKLRNHRLEASAIDVNEFVLKRKEWYMKPFQKYRQELADSELTIYRYEDVIYRKEWWLADLVDKLGLKVVPGQISAVSKQSDIFPREEDDKKHIRQVHPGNYKQKLSTKTIEQLNDALGEFLTYFDYEH